MVATGPAPATGVWHIKLTATAGATLTSVAVGPTTEATTVVFGTATIIAGQLLTLDIYVVKNANYDLTLVNCTVNVGWSYIDSVA